jgi:hypothetical protein
MKRLKTSLLNELPSDQYRLYRDLPPSVFTFRAIRLPGVPGVCPRWVLAALGAIFFTLAYQPGPARANVAGGIIPGSPNVTVVENADGTVTMSNGIVAIAL